jgi:hypothetical protein
VVGTLGLPTAGTKTLRRAQLQQACNLVVKGPLATTRWKVMPNRYAHRSLLLAYRLTALLTCLSIGHALPSGRPRRAPPRTLGFQVNPPYAIHSSRNDAALGPIACSIVLTNQSVVETLSALRTLPELLRAIEQSDRAALSSARRGSRFRVGDLQSSFAFLVLPGYWARGGVLGTGRAPHRSRTYRQAKMFQILGMDGTTACTTLGKSFDAASGRGG